MCPNDLNLTFSDVVVHKKVGTEDFPNDIYKGKTSINVPVAFLMNYLLNMDNKPEYDDVFESGKYNSDRKQSYFAPIAVEFTL